MPNIICKCNQLIELGAIPSPNQHLIVSDIRFEEFQGLVDAEEIYNVMQLVAKCPYCGRLHVFWDGSDKPQTIYKQEL